MFFRAPNMQNMQCMMMTGPSSVIIGGHQTKVIELEVEHKEVIREVKDFFSCFKIFFNSIRYFVLQSRNFFFMFFYFRNLKILYFWTVLHVDNKIFSLKYLQQRTFMGFFFSWVMIWQFLKIFFPSQVDLFSLSV